jgi:hypothetical protein
MGVQTCNVTAYRNTVSWQCGRDSWPRNVLKVGYTITLREFSVRCGYLAAASKGWYGYGLLRSGRVTWYVTTVRSSRLYIHDASGSCNKLGTLWCKARRILLRHEAWDESSDRNSVSCESLAALRYAVTLQVCTHLKRSLRRADHSFRGVLPTLVRRCVWSRKLVNKEALTHWGL